MKKLESFNGKSIDTIDSQMIKGGLGPSFILLTQIYSEANSAYRDFVHGFESCWCNLQKQHGY
jgi:hypothetical protein